MNRSLPALTSSTNPDPRPAAYRPQPTPPTLRWGFPTGPTVSNPTDLYTQLFSDPDYCPPGSGLARISDHADLLKSLRRGHVLELGSGRGEVVQWASHEGFNALGLDCIEQEYDRRILGANLATNPRAHLSVLYFDWVWSFDVLPHLPPAVIPELLQSIGQMATWGQVHLIETGADRHLVGDQIIDLHQCQHAPAWWLEQVHQASPPGTTITVQYSEAGDRLVICAIHPSSAGH